MKLKLPATFYNRATLLGVALSVTAFAIILLLLALDAFSPRKSPYMGLLTFILLPAFLVAGVAMAVWGVVRARRRAAEGKAPEELPRIDFNDPVQRNAAAFVLFGGMFFVGISGFGSYQAYEYTETVNFCGNVCHKVMEPEHTAYLGSPHARVTCVQCHIGSGATWFVKSKVTGSYQVYSVLFNKYSRPIETPIHNLRPATETCEKCHWPGNFYSAKQQSHRYYAPDEKNSVSQLEMLVKIGGGDPEHGASSGIHAHMYLANTVSYIAVDRKRTRIPYVVSTAPDGTETVFRSTDNPATEEQLKKGERRTVDCIDCHNRPTHIFRNPSRSVNQALSLGKLSVKLPEVKAAAVGALEGEYATKAAAQEGIQKAFTGFYATKYPQAAKARQAEIRQAVDELRTIYSRNYFPEMKSNWKGFPDNVGHMYADGCFRCHDGKHVSASGKVITKDCNACHTIISQKTGDGPASVSLTGQEFRHPGEVGDMWKEANCSTCHGPQT